MTMTSSVFFVGILHLIDERVRKIDDTAVFTFFEKPSVVHTRDYGCNYRYYHEPAQVPS